MFILTPELILAILFFAIFLPIIHIHIILFMYDIYTLR